MASFQAKQVRKGGEREKIKISFRSVPFLPDGKFKIPKKEKKNKKSTILASFQAKIGW